MYTSESKTIANSFNDYFINVGSTLANNIHSNVDPLLYIQRNPNIITISDVIESEINTIIRNIKNSSSGYDELPTSIMKTVSEEYIKPLTYMIKKTISLGHFPEELKLARVIPINKGENDQLIQNYRPISVLPFNNILYDYQFGFRKHHSTSHAIITLVERVERRLIQGK